MGFTCGIVGLPNAGKSTLFNAMTKSAQAETANYAFTTIDPNIGRVSVPDPRLDKLAELAKSKKIVPTFLDFADIAGLVRGASDGEGLGNQFLGHIREVDAILFVLRSFDDDNISHVENRVDPVADAETVETELMLADLESLERREIALSKKAKGDDKDAKEILPLMSRALAWLRTGEPCRTLEIDPSEEKALRGLQLLTAKPAVYIANVDEESAATGNAHSEKLATWAAEKGAPCVYISAAIEAEISGFDDEAERAEFLESMGLEETGLARVIHTGYALLDLVTFFTAGPTESRAWTVPKGTPAPEAAGTIHTDFERGFIRAETIAYDDYIACEGESGARDAGKLRLEGKDYIVQDGDVLLIRFNV
jgi:GTP-binding protein YchF